MAVLETSSFLGKTIAAFIPKSANGNKEHMYLLTYWPILKNLANFMSGFSSWPSYSSLTSENVVENLFGVFFRATHLSRVEVGESDVFGQYERVKVTVCCLSEQAKENCKFGNLSKAASRKWMD